MPESIQHVRLVEKTIEYIHVYIGVGYSFSVLHDLPASLGADKPPRIEGFVPDIYAQDTPATLTVIGEAKTANDLATAHTERQLLAFFRHLETQPRGILVIAVPWVTRAAASSLLKRCWREASCCRSEFVVVDDVDLAGKL